MALREILSIAGKSGLFKLVAQSRNSIIVEELESGKKMPIYAAHKVSSLEDISIYTYEEDIPLGDVLRMIRDKENGGEAVDHKAGANEHRAYMASILPDYDAERVYDSDLKKLFYWYNLLCKSDLLKMLDDEEVEEQVEVKEEVKEEAKPAAKAEAKGKGKGKK